ncbi:hypothetical protein [Micromonospora costi]|uniref:DUF3291 domain-containing protein n=1 Tax=Micromonospora costi TaxID=1530042 RepID=A0A3B0A0P4_9ACTN|nr:hypothetical protein [Micromonospora costi]RKN54103.1 hypothetical protein D7193_18930 [Micromonospora costi]
MTPVIEPDPAKGQVVVTRFNCGNLPRMLLVLIMHVRMKRHVRRQAVGYLGIKVLVDWRQRVVLSISLWRDLDSVYSMGRVTRHVGAARAPGRLGITTTCGVFCYAGEWTRVMFGGPTRSTSPLHPPAPAPDRPSRPATASTV